MDRSSAAFRLLEYCIRPFVRGNWFGCSLQKNLGFPQPIMKSTKVLMATPQGRRLGYHTTEQVSNQEPQDSRPCVLTTTLLGGSLVWLFSPAWDAVKLTMPGGWLHLSFRCRRPYQFRSDDGSCSRTNA